MTKKILLIFTIGLFLINLSCSSKEKKPVPEEAKLAQRAFSIAEQLRDAYLIKDNNTFKRLCTRAGYLKIISSVKDFDSATLHFKPQWVDMENNQLILYIRWEGSWVKGTEKIDEKGLTAFKYKLAPLLLDDILRDNPFSYPK